MELNKENLYNEYIVKDKTQEECSKIFNVSKWFITNSLKTYEITKYSNKKSFFDKMNTKVNKYYGDDFIISSNEYINRDNVKVLHKICGKEFVAHMRTHDGKKYCPFCGKDTNRKRILKIKKLYLEENLSIEKVAKNIGLSRAQVSNLIRENEIVKSEEQKKLSKSDSLKKWYKENDKLISYKEQIISLLKNGFLQRELANYYQVSQSYISSYIKRNDLGKYVDKDKTMKKKTEKTKKTCLEKYGVVTPLNRSDVIQKAMDGRSFISKPEIELREYIQSIYPGEVTRTNDGAYELDIYVPDKKVGIEYNGNYWHSLKNKEKSYHYDKSKHYEDKGIRVIHIWEYEWDNPRQRPILENIIKNALGLNSETIYARKCKIEIRSSASMRDFFDKNNIQGFRGGKFAICLVYNGEVVMAYMMGHCFFGKGKYEWEVIRGATKLGYTVIGGASKIWNYFIKEYNPENCVYYIDYNYFNGNSLPYLGLTYLKSQPSFKNWWVKTNEVKNREPMRHNEIMRLQALGEVVPIYNAGTKVYVWENNNIKSGNK